MVQEKKQTADQKAKEEEAKKQADAAAGVRAATECAWPVCS